MILMKYLGVDDAVDAVSCIFGLYIIDFFGAFLCSIFHRLFSQKFLYKRHNISTGTKLVEAL